MDKEWLNYTSPNLRNTIYYITWYLKPDLLKIMHARLNTSNLAYVNKQRWVKSTFISLSTLSLSTCKNPICSTKKSWYTTDKYWESHPELCSIWQQNLSSSGIKIKTQPQHSLHPFIYLRLGPVDSQRLWQWQN